MPGDEGALSLVGRATFLETFAGILDGRAIVEHCAHAHAAAVYRAWLEDAQAAAWLVETVQGNAPVGFMVIAAPQLPLPDTRGDVELKRIYLLGRFRGGGVGKQLIQAAIAHARAAGARRLLLGVYAHNHAAIGFYERCGFGKVGARKFNVGGQAFDDHMMALEIGSPAGTP